MSCGVRRKRGLDPTLLWLWCRLEARVPIRPLAWEPPYAVGAALGKAKRQKKKKKKKNHSSNSFNPSHTQVSNKRLWTEYGSLHLSLIFLMKILFLTSELINLWKCLVLLLPPRVRVTDLSQLLIVREDKSTSWRCMLYNFEPNLILCIYLSEV